MEAGEDSLRRQLRRLKNPLLLPSISSLCASLGIPRSC